LKAEAIERMADAKKYEQEKVAEGQKKAITATTRKAMPNQIIKNE
jgi:hypothetical protein